MTYLEKVEKKLEALNSRRLFLEGCHFAGKKALELRELKTAQFLCDMVTEELKVLDEEAGELLKKYL